MDDLNKRITKVNQQIRQIIKQQEKETARRYARVLATIRAEMAKQYEKYEKDGKLSLQEMLKFERLKKLNQRMEHILTTHYKGFGEQLKGALGGTYQDGYYQTAYNLEMHIKKKIGFKAVRPETLKAMLDNPVNGLTLNQRLQQRRAQIIQAIQRQITIGLQANESYSSMAKRLKGELEGDTVKAMRIVRTEGHRVQESAKHDAMEFANSNGVVMMKQWNSLEDERVRGNKGIANHRKLNNKKIPMDGIFDDGLSKGPAPGQLPAAASSINCRCFLTYSVEKVVKKDLKDIETATFDQWKKENIKEVEMPEEEIYTPKVGDGVKFKIKGKGKDRGKDIIKEGVISKIDGEWADIAGVDGTDYKDRNIGTIIEKIDIPEKEEPKKEKPKTDETLTESQRAKIEITHAAFLDELENNRYLSDEVKKDFAARFKAGKFANNPLKIDSLTEEVLVYEPVGNLFLAKSINLKNDISDKDVEITSQWVKEHFQNEHTDGVLVRFQDDLDTLSYIGSNDEIKFGPFLGHDHDGFDEEDIAERFLNFKRVMFHELGHRVHQVPGERLMATQAEFDNLKIRGTIKKDDWKTWKKAVDTFYNPKGSAPEYKRMDYAANGHKQYGRSGTKQHFYIEMFADSFSIYMERDKEEYRKMDKEFPGILGTLEKILKHGFYKK